MTTKLEHAEDSERDSKTSRTASHSFIPDLISLRTWLLQNDVSATTAWRWRRDGKLKTVNIHGRAYLTRQAREEFLARAESGDFAQEPIVPKREKFSGGLDDKIIQGERSG